MFCVTPFFAKQTEWFMVGDSLHLVSYLLVLPAEFFIFDIHITVFYLCLLVICSVDDELNAHPWHHLCPNRISI